VLARIEWGSGTPFGVRWILWALPWVTGGAVTPRLLYFTPDRGEESGAHPYIPRTTLDDLDAWWTHIASLDLRARFGVPAPKAPAVQPWGVRVAYVIDPSGVLWHVAQRRADSPHDE
jgi:hypothetical protein